MTRRFKPLDRLLGEQATASAPDAFVWLSAAAGTGKTHVLSARVLRLLLNGVDPAAILCLTFTKAGAAEMADRIHERLAHWVRLPPDKLRKDLFALGEPHDDRAVAIARTLFARVLDAAGGGLRIQTIHAFCQTLLAAFPLEAGLSPGFKPLDARAQAALARTTLAELLVVATERGDERLITDMQTLSVRLGEAGAEAFLASCARAPDAMAALGGDVEARVRDLLELPDGDIDALLCSHCADELFDCETLRAIAAANRGWGTATGDKHATLSDAFLAGDPAARVAMIRELTRLVTTADGEPRKHSPKLVALEPRYPALAAALGDRCRELLELSGRAAFAQMLGAALRAGQAYAAAYGEAKRRSGAVDFDDLIRDTARLLSESGMSEWVRYKLDQETDHILIDEAQDTNLRQWSIVANLAAEYFADAGAKDDARMRTIFTVGDFKQAIFGFQGTSPEAFRAAQNRFRDRAKEGLRPFAEIALDRSFRSTPPVLALIDRVLADLGPEALGLDSAPPRHRSSPAKARLPGSVTLWKGFVAPGDDPDDGEEGWASDTVRGYATALARQVRAWLAEGLPLATRGRALRPEDIMILVRKRGELVPLLIARLHAEGVPVAGADRLRLTAPLAVRDLLAAARFALNPADDLNLANLLVSPLIGVEQDELFRIRFDRGASSLWVAVRDRAPAVAEPLTAVLARADFTTPYRFLEELLSGPLDGRRKLLGRLGEEARDPIEELQSAALAFESEATPSLQRFVDWFDRGEVEIVRDPAAPLDAVRVMTVHGAKGLQAPLVILADATADPDLSPLGTIEIDDGETRLPILRPRRAEAFGRIGAALERTRADERREHWRLLYVAATRAEERLVVGGALGGRLKDVAPSASWYAAVATAMDGLDAGWADDPIWTASQVYNGEANTPTARLPRAAATAPVLPRLPHWAAAVAPREQRPPRPLAPSAIGRDLVPDPPPGATMRAAARRGELLHALFQRLPALNPADRPGAARTWLERAGAVDDAGERGRLADDACAILSDPAFAAIFRPDALTEAPLAAVVSGEVVAGTVDRLLIEPDRILVADFKTGRRVPQTIEQVPGYHLAQMGAYAAALAIIFPGRPVEASLLYTSGPRLFLLPPDLLARYKPGFVGPEQSLISAR